MQRKLIFLASFFLCANCFAQQYPFVQYSPREGLINNRARFIFQDSKGKLYISTFGGLSVYDGSRFINYTMNNGLAVNLVNDIVEMGEDSIWVLPNDNKVQYIVNGKIKNFKTDDGFTPLINQMIKCSDGYYYAIADEGLFRLENRRFVKMDLTGLPQAGPIKTLLRFGEFDKKLYILSNPDYKQFGSNLLVYDLSKNKLDGFDAGVNALNLFQLSAGELWVLTPKGMCVVDHSSKTILKPLPDSFHITREMDPHFIFRDKQNNTWVAGARGIYKIKTTGETTSFTIENGLTTNFQTSIFQDHENNMWFTNDQTGLCKLSNPQLAYYPVFREGLTPTDIFIQPGSDSVWIHDGYHHRVMLILPNGGIQEWTSSTEALTHPGRFVVANGEWIVSGYNVFHWNPMLNSNRYSLTMFYKDTGTFGFNSVLKDKNGNLVAVSNKLVVLAGKKILSQYLNYMADQLTIDKNNRVWVAPRSNQLYCFEISGTGDATKLSLLKTFTNMPLGSPRSIAADQAGNIWIGTRDQGLYCLHFDGLNLASTKQVTTLNGLSENFVSNLYCDKENNIWACTPSGVDKIKLMNDHFLVENITKSGNLYLPILKIQQTGKGLVWILTATGIITYDPFRLISNWKPSLEFSGVMIGKGDGNPLPAGSKLSHDQNNLSFQLSAPTYIDEKQTRFSYLLEGSGNKNWSTPSTDASINFVNLPPGEYVLKSKAIFLHGLYPDIESSYPFTILPPWWQTWWFRLVAVLLIIGLLVIAARFYYNRKLEKQKIGLEKQRAVEKERTRIATDMHDDLGAGLSQIKFLSETIGMRKQKHLPIEEEIDSIRTFSNEMIDKMGEIVWALNEKNDTLSDLLSYTRSYAVEYLQQNGIRCVVEEPDNLPQDYVSSEFRRNIYLTVKETLHNVVKHAQATEVLITIDISDALKIQIKDNGKGVDNDVPGRLGNGLINMNTRIKALNGRFGIVNNNGTEVNIFVPLNT
jgi:ligand-binding sensor domain-containing protein